MRVCTNMADESTCIATGLTIGKPGHNNGITLGHMANAFGVKFALFFLITLRHRKRQ